ncbi:STM4014 family protein [Streptomyces sp. NBC_01221]|uniref:STM4014 family protein n=1 Tax=unclassified Streptomyces TaxID=2593676 RepID=UPI00225AE945|nr:MULTISPECIES: STM4014 family protein [unclassified Streptomyces]WSP59046.1 STM4014 family protein [Streptomyces sp. NBC_01241]WSU20433.1 STM4014 family protein [Streptomyces sp. NBC_01108]MCX4790783.1 STM4014 family protein [Streptomyces sp. NBC_01221]MCX4793487.1 STM4014 family protein [Streptomyces sp. NBC_01242]WSJ34919.1 STM4014 family protein [Streptomyces sp. NBC_01321]
MSPSASNTAGPAPRFAVVGVPGNRRVALFQDAVRAAGLPAARVVSWLDVLRGEAAFRPGETVRMDSPGEDAEVERLLRAVGDPTRVEGTALWYARFTDAVRAVAQAAAASGAALLDDPGDVAVLFDKRLCHAVLDDAGVRVPASPTSGAAAPEVRDWADVRERMTAHNMPRAFVKLAHGSSASGVLAVETAGPGRVRATTSVERDTAGRLFNSLRVRRCTTEREVAAIVDALAPDGLHIERWLPKATQCGRAADLRVVVVAGRATHAVVRTSDSPMTNLHLGGTRGDLDDVRAAVEAAGSSWTEALALCERAAACFPDTLCVGVDLLPSTGWRRFAVGEVNAFGDLLPRLTGLPGSGAEGQDTYAAQVAAVLNRARNHRATATP